MIERRPSHSGLRGERGVILPMTAVMALALLAVVAYLAMRPAFARLASAQLRREIDALCSDISKVPVLTTEMADAFAAGIANIQLSAGTIVRARLITPALPSDIEEDVAVNSSLSCGSVPECEHIVDVHSVTDLHYPRGDIFWGGDGSGAVDLNAVSGGVVVACEATAALSSQDLMQFFRGDIEEVTVRTAYWAPPRNWDPASDNPAEYATYRHANDDYNNRYATRGLSIIIAPHMTTPPESGRIPKLQTDVFKINNEIGDDELDADDKFSENFLNLFGALDVAAGANKAFSFADPDTTFDGARIPGLGGLSGTAQSEMVSACMNLPVMVRNMFLATIVQLASRNGILRNRTSLYLAGTQHRILQAQDNPIRRAADGDNGVRDDNAPLFPSLPVELVHAAAGGTAGTPLLNQTYTHPYVFYYEGVASGGSIADADRLAAFNTAFNVRPGQSLAGVAAVRVGTDIRQGWLFPFGKANGSATVPDEEYLAHDPDNAGDVAEKMKILLVRSLRAKQLRNCFHLYSKNLLRIDADVHNEGLQFDWASKTLGGDKTFRAHTRESNYSSAAAWDSVDGEGLDAYELVKTLGTIQSCPFEIGGDLPASRFAENDGSGNFAFGNGNSGRCWKPFETDDLNQTDTAGPDLRPDIAGALWAIHRASGTRKGDDAIRFSSLESGSLQEFSQASHALFPPLKSPGLAARDAGYEMRDDMEADEIATVPYPLGLSASDSIYSRDTINDNLANADASMILVVTHTPITENEVFEIADVVQELNTLKTGPRIPRGVVIVYMPVRQPDATKIISSRFMRALGIGDPTAGEPPGTWQGAHLNSFVLMSPHREEFWLAGTNMAYPEIATAPYLEFKRYWRHLLHPDPETLTEDGYVKKNAIGMGFHVFYDILNPHEPKA